MQIYASFLLRSSFLKVSPDSTTISINVSFVKSIPIMSSCSSSTPVAQAKNHPTNLKIKYSHLTLSDLSHAQKIFSACKTCYVYLHIFALVSSLKMIKLFCSYIFKQEGHFEEILQSSNINHVKSRYTSILESYN